MGVLPIHKIHKVGKAFKAGRKVYRSFKSSKKIRRITRRARASVKVLRKNISRIKKPSRVRAVIRKVKQKVSRPQCFTAGTLISTSAGLKPIEQIKKGDYVWAEDPNTGEVAKKEVQQTFVNETNLLIKLVVNGEIIETTEEHPFWVENQGWLPARELKKGDLVRLQTGKVLSVEKVTMLVLKEPVKVYNFQVEDYHTYYVSDEQVLVHNMCAKKNNKKIGWKIGRIKGSQDKGKGYFGIRYAYKKRNGNRVIRSIEIHPDHNGHGIHLQRNKFNPKMEDALVKLSRPSPFGHGAKRNDDPISS